MLRRGAHGQAWTILADDDQAVVSLARDVARANPHWWVDVTQGDRIVCRIEPRRADRVELQGSLL